MMILLYLQPTKIKLDLSGMLEFNTDEFEKQIEIKLPQTPHLVKEEDIEIELFNSLEVDISSSALVGALCNHQMAITYDRIFPPVDISVAEAIVHAKQSENYAHIFINRSESPIPTAIEVSWIAKPESPSYPVQTGVCELYESGQRTIEFPLPEKPTTDEIVNIEFQLVKAEMHTKDNRQTCSIINSRANLQVVMDKSMNSIYIPTRSVAFKQSDRTAKIEICRTMATGMISVPWKTVSDSPKYSKMSGVVEFEPGILHKSIEVVLDDLETSDDEDDFTLVVMNPICEEEIIISGPNEIDVKVRV